MLNANGLKMTGMMIELPRLAENLPPGAVSDYLAVHYFPTFWDGQIWAPNQASPAVVADLAKMPAGDLDLDPLGVYEGCTVPETLQAALKRDKRIRHKRAIVTNAAMPWNDDARKVWEKHGPWDLEGRSVHVVNYGPERSEMLKTMKLRKPGHMTEWEGESRAIAGLPEVDFREFFGEEHGNLMNKGFTEAELPDMTPVAAEDITDLSEVPMAEGDSYHPHTVTIADTCWNAFGDNVDAWRTFLEMTVDWEESLLDLVETVQALQAND